MERAKEYFWDTKFHIHTYIYIYECAHTHSYIHVYM